ncbi:unnamed protein product [Cochlearia groenlandica]
MIMEPDNVIEHRSPSTEDRVPSTEHQGARAPCTEVHKGVITRSKAKELAKVVQAMIMEEELGGAARSLFNIYIMT